MAFECRKARFAQTTRRLGARFNCPRDHNCDTRVRVQFIRAVHRSDRPETLADVTHFLCRYRIYGTTATRFAEQTYYF